MSGDTREFNSIASQAFINFFFLQGKAPKEIDAILKETLGEYAPSYTTVKNWVAQFKRGYFSTCVAPRSGRQKR
jgi:transposase